MRESRTAQRSIFESYSQHQIGFELKRISAWLDEHPELLDLVGADVPQQSSEPRGRPGLTVETVLRCAILKQYRQVDYRTLAFYLEDSVCFVEFARLDGAKPPGKSALQALISGISDETWLALNRCLLSSAGEQGIEHGSALRVDSTVTSTNIAEPSDSGLLCDSVRVINRLLRQARREFDLCRYPTHNRRARRGTLAILNAGSNARRRPLYEQLLTVTATSVEYLRKARNTLKNRAQARPWCEQVDHYLGLILRVMDQTHRRVILGEAVPSGQKIVSLFEPHTDIIVKGRREVQYGHKITLATGASALVLDVVIEQGNPGDSQCLVPVLQRHIEHYGQAPQDLAVDGGYTSRNNLEQAKAMGVQNACFHKRVALTIEEMTGERWLYNKLRRFRAGIEASISYLKRCFGLSRCNWKGLAHFKSYVCSAVFTHNLVRLAHQAPG